MKRIYPEFSYGDGPKSGCWWDTTIPAPDWPALTGEIRVDVAIVGGGFTGMSAALHLAEAGVSVALLEAKSPGWGASGRNGGFCCVGGARLSETALARQYGTKDAAEYARAEIAAVDLAETLINRLDIDVDRHSHGETQLAHSAKAMDKLRRDAQTTANATLLNKDELASAGMNGPFFGGLSTPVGFGLNPRKYLFGLARAARSAGAQLFQSSPAQAIERTGPGYIIRSPQGQISCKTILIATNGYSSEDMPGWLAGRYMPTQSSVLVTRPMSDAELAAQGWTSDRMAYDTRNLLHYFRLMPDRRFLFGMRGGLLSSPRSERRSRAKVRQDFEEMFPAWRHIESPFHWSGLVCLARNQVPFVGPVPGQPGVFTGLAYHGNGVAMGTWSGRALAHLAMAESTEPPLPAIMRHPMARFPFGRARRMILPPVYAWMGLRDL